MAVYVRLEGWHDNHAPRKISWDSPNLTSFGSGDINSMNNFTLPTYPMVPISHPKSIPPKQALEISAKFFG